jgi:hypothetical protein
MIPTIRNDLSWKSSASRWATDRAQQLHDDHDEEEVVDALRDLG